MVLFYDIQMELNLRRVFKIKRTTIKIDRFIAFYYVLLGVIAGYVISRLHSQESPLQWFFQYPQLVTIIAGGLILFTLLLAMGLSSLIAHRLPYHSDKNYLEVSFFELVFLFVWYSVLATMPYAAFISWRHFFVRDAGLYFKVWFAGFIMCFVGSSFKKWFPFEKFR